MEEFLNIYGIKEFLIELLQELHEELHNEATNNRWQKSVIGVRIFDRMPFGRMSFDQTPFVRLPFFPN